MGVELSVTPNVENDDTISLILEPKVTEFEGFVEYGGPSVAIAGDTTVTVPAGFYQPPSLPAKSLPRLRYLMVLL